MINRQEARIRHEYAREVRRHIRARDGLDRNKRTPECNFLRVASLFVDEEEL